MTHAAFTKHKRSGIWIACGKLDRKELIAKGDGEMHMTYYVPVFRKLFKLCQNWIYILTFWKTFSSTALFRRHKNFSYSSWRIACCRWYSPMLHILLFDVAVDWNMKHSVEALFFQYLKRWFFDVATCLLKVIHSRAQPSLFLVTIESSMHNVLKTRITSLLKIKGPESNGWRPFAEGNLLAGACLHRFQLRPGKGTGVAFN